MMMMEPVGRRGEPLDVYDASGSKPLDNKHPQRTPPASSTTTSSTTTTTTTKSTSHVDDVMEWLDQKTKLGQAKASNSGYDDDNKNGGGYSEGEDTDEDDDPFGGGRSGSVSGAVTWPAAADARGPPSYRTSDSSQPTLSSRRSAEPPGLYHGAMMEQQEQQQTQLQKQQQQPQQQQQQQQPQRPMMLTEISTAEAVAILVPGNNGSSKSGDPSGSTTATAPHTIMTEDDWVSRKIRRDSKGQAATCSSAMHTSSSSTTRPLLDDDEIMTHVVDGKLAPEEILDLKAADPPDDNDGDVEGGAYSESGDSQHDYVEVEEEEDGEKYIKGILDTSPPDIRPGRAAAASDSAARPPGAYSVPGPRQTADDSSSTRRASNNDFVHVVPTAVLVSSGDDDDDDDENDHQDHRRRGSHIPTAAVVARGDSTKRNGTSTTTLSNSRNRNIGIAAFVLLGIVVICVVVAFVVNRPEEPPTTDAATTDDDLWYKVVDPMDGSPGSEFGSSVSMCSDGSRVAIGAQGSGEVQVYELNNPISGARIQIGQTITHNVTQTVSDAFIRSQVVVELARNCKVLAIGYPFETVGDKKMAGQVELYEYDADLDAWLPLGDPHIIPGEEESDFAGASIALSQAGDRIAIGSPGNDYAGTDAGRARVFLVNRGGWELLGTAINGTTPGEELGGSISLTSHESAGTYILAVGLRTKPKEGYVYTLSAEAARVYEFQTGLWSERGQGVAPEMLGIDTAWFVKLSSDGEKLVVSNLYMDPDGVRVLDGEVNAGIFVAAYDLDWKAGKWVPRGGNIHANFPGKKSGYIIALSDDGSRIGMGDPGRAEAGGLAGHSHFYEFIEDQWCQLGPNIHGESAGDMAGYSVSMSGDGKRMV
jgi:hypothetical protein